MITARSYRLALNAFKALYTCTDNCNDDNEDDDDNDNYNNNINDHHDFYGDASDYDKGTAHEVKRVVERKCDRRLSPGC